MKNSCYLAVLILLLSACKTPTGIYNNRHYSDSVHVSNAAFIKTMEERNGRYQVRDAERKLANRNHHALYSGQINSSQSKLIDRAKSTSGAKLPTGVERARNQQDMMQMRMNLHRMEMMQNRPSTFTPAAHQNMIFR